MSRGALTDPQRAMLRAIDDYGEYGWERVDEAFSRVRPLPRQLEAALAHRVAHSLYRRALITDPAVGAELTPLGARYLAVTP